MAKTVDKTYFVQIYNTCIPHEPDMSKHEYTTSAGKFVNGYTKQMGIIPTSTICGQIYIWGTYTVWPYMAFSVCFQSEEES